MGAGKSPWHTSPLPLALTRGSGVSAGLCGGGRMEAAYLQLQCLLQLELVLLPGCFQAVQLLAFTLVTSEQVIK